MAHHFQRSLKLCRAPAFGALVALFAGAMGAACSSAHTPADELDAAVAAHVVERALPTLSAAFVDAIRIAQDSIDTAYTFRHVPTGAWAAPQPHQATDQWLDDDTIVVDDDALRLRFDSFGRASGHSQSISLRSLRVRDQRATASSGAAEVWFANGLLGLEHGLKFATAPPGEGHLVVDVATSVPALPASLPIAGAFRPGIRAVAYTGHVAWPAVARGAGGPLS